DTHRPRGQLPGPRGHDADAPRGAGCDDRAAGPRRQRVVPARQRPGRPPRRGAVPRTARGGAGRPPVGGPVHRRRHRERQPGDQGALLGPPRRRLPPPADRREPGRAPRRPGQRGVAGQARRCRRHLAAGGADRPDHPGVAGRGAGRRVGRGGGQRHVGQQRDRRRQRHRRARRRRARGRCTPAHRRGAGRGPGAGGLRGERRRRADHDRPQARRADGSRGAAPAPRRRLHPAPARRRAGARRPLGHPRRRRDRRAGSGDGVGRGLAARAGRPARRASRPTGGRRGRAGARRAAQRTAAGGPGGVRAGPAARQRPPVLPRGRGRRAAHAAGRPRDRVLHRLGVQRRGGPSQPRAAGHGGRRRARSQLAALQPGPHLRGRRRRRGARRDRTGRGAGPPSGPEFTM
ncbi:MAG: Cysteine desulfurase, partial [uncultured Blastococcus sp.]